MKKTIYQSAILIVIFALSISVLSLNRAEPKPEKLLAYNFVKCTPAKFLLGAVDTTQQISPLFNNLGNLHFKVSTKKERTQAFFDQGLKLSYAFNHAEAHRSFMVATRLEPNVAMNYWGQAFALGPNINDPQPDDARKQKYNEAIDVYSLLGLKYPQKSIYFARQIEKIKKYI